MSLISLKILKFFVGPLDNSCLVDRRWNTTVVSQQGLLIVPPLDFPPHLWYLIVCVGGRGAGDQIQVLIHYHHTSPALQYWEINEFRI